MADVGVYTKNADIQARCGTNANATAKAVAATDVYVLDVEAMINCLCNYDFSTNYASLTTATKVALKEAGACYCAINVIMQDTSGYSGGDEWWILVNSLWVRYKEAMRGLDKNGQELMGAP